MKVKPSNRRRAVDAPSRSWSDSQKLEAVTTYLSLGNLALTSRVLKIPEMTLREWKQKDWWKEIEGELKVQDNIQLSSRLKRIIESTLSVTEDRLANGDWIYDNKTGQLVRKPVNMRDAHKVAMDMIEKREILDNKAPTSVSVEQIDDKLKKLAEKFEQIAAGRRPLEVTDVIIGTEVSVANGS
jgi:transposase-like protein